MTLQDQLQDTVLVVEDSDDTLRFLVDTLTAAEKTVLVAKSGEAAVELVRHFTPDLILMDAIMPGLDGFETTRLLKALPALAHVPVVFMTGLTEAEHVVQAFAAGGVDYVRKPVVVDELLARVRVHMANGRAVHAGAAGLDATGRMMLSISADGRLLWCTPLAEQVLTRFAPGWQRGEGALPPELTPVVGRLLGARAAIGGTIKIEHGSRTLEFTLLSQYRDHEWLIRLNEIDPAADVEGLSSHLGLTHREAEVLLWVSYGKPNRVISEILDISPRTVNKHLERVFEKLGVETRSAAASIAIRAIGN